MQEPSCVSFVFVRSLWDVTEHLVLTVVIDGSTFLQSNPPRRNIRLSFCSNRLSNLV